MPRYLQFIAVNILMLRVTVPHVLAGPDMHFVCEKGTPRPQAHAADESCLSCRSQPDPFFASPKAGYDKVINENAVPHLFIPSLVSLIRPRS